MNAPVETDYLVVGAGASGLAFVDALVSRGGRRGDGDRPPARAGRSLGGCVSVRPAAHPVRVLRRELAGARRGSDRRGRRERRVLRTRDGGGGARALRRGGRATRGDGAGPGPHGARAPGRRPRARPSLGRAPRRRGAAEAGRCALSRGVRAGDAHAGLRGRRRRPRGAGERPAGRGGIGIVDHDPRVRQDGGGRLRLAAGQRHRAGRHPVDPSA